MFDAELEVQNIGVDPRNHRFERAIAGARCIIADKTPEAGGRQRATECARYRCQRHHSRKCCKPALAEQSGALRGPRFRAGVLIAVPIVVAG